jgi:hypothetical protein
MASKNDLGDTKKNVQAQQQSSNSSFTGQQDSSRQKSNEQYATGQGRSDDLYNRNAQLASIGSLAPAAQTTASSMQGMGGAPNIAQGHAADLATSGGVDMGALHSTIPQYQAQQTGNEVQNWQSMEKNGGLDDADKNNYLGGGVYKNFADTGGFSGADKNRYMQQATATVPAMYSQMANEMARRRSVQGGYSPGFTNSMGLLARQKSQDMASTTMNAQNSLLDQVNKNKLAGASGLQSGQGAFSSLQTGNRLASTAGANNAIMSAINAQTAAEQRAQELRQQGMIAGTGLETSQANTSAQNQRAVMDTQNNNMTGGLKNMQDLYGTNVQQGETFGGQNLSSITGQAGANNAYAGTLEKNAEATPGFMDELSSGLGMAGGVLTGMSGMGGVSKMFGKKTLGAYDPNTDWA